MRDTVAACPVEWTLEVIGGKWKCVILWHLRNRVRPISTYGATLSPLLEIMCKWGIAHRHNAAKTD